MRRCTTPCALNPHGGFLVWLNTGRAKWPSASERAFAFSGAGGNTTVVEPADGLVSVTRWLDPARFDARDATMRGLEARLCAASRAWPHRPGAGGAAARRGAARLRPSSMNRSSLWLALALAVPLGAAAPALGQPTLNDVLPNFAGFGVGVGHNFGGGDRTIWGVVPAGRVALGGERFASVAGPMAEINLLDSRFLQAGPVAVYRFGRSGTERRGAGAVGDRDATVELGGRFGVSWINTAGPVPFRLRVGVAVTGDAGGRYGGVQVLPAGSVWVPLSPTLFVGAGAYARFASAGHNQYFYEISPVAAAASGLPAFRPDGGYASAGAWPAVAWRVTDRWAVGGGAVYTRLSDDVARSPLIARGARHGVVAGVGAAYTW